MKNVKIGFSMAMNGEKTATFTANGKISQNQLVFTDDENTVYRFELSPTEVILHKTGTSLIEMTFQDKQITYGTLSTDGLQFDLVIYTKELLAEDGTIYLTYELLDGDTVISHHSLYVNWTPKIERKDLEQTWLN